MLQKNASGAILDTCFTEGEGFFVSLVWGRYVVVLRLTPGTALRVFLVGLRGSVTTLLWPHIKGLYRREDQKESIRMKVMQARAEQGV